jgi:signal transduction histidine kinase
MLARGIHRTVVAFLVVGVALGGLAGGALHAAWTSGVGAGAFLCVGLSVLATAWPLTWLATFHIAWPLRELATVAGELRSGRLERRDQLPRGPGEVGEVGEALRGISERLAKQLRDQRALMAAVSHELRSPLGRARVLVELAREGSGAPTAYDDLQGEIDAMDGLVGDLLAAARIDFEAISPRELDATDAARRALELASMPADALVVHDGGVVNADPTLLSRALAVLLDNGRRYGGQTVRLHVRGRSTRVRFEVEDDGPGFPPGDEERAFQPFWRGPATGERAAPGEGLGLALVRQIAQAHDGHAAAQNRPEGGARVWLELPRA